MLEQVKSALVDSFVGAIAVGLLLFSGISQMLGAVINPITVWLLQRQYPENYPAGLPRPMPTLGSMLPELIRAALLLLIAYALLRWLYFPAPEKQDQDAASESGQDA